ncbi:TPA: AAA family ATPase [Escherichia coli]|nr:hypothetical protein [Escherichia coli]EEW4317103.1 hypothetical protein [Escherichia coli]HBA6378381.1 AAA family ATPase [Escherichia coli]HBA6397421.1 AAA family ATPase [Escherichia coli]HBA6684795.1 AAA family ATPase [Escherichia coli]
MKQDIEASVIGGLLIGGLTPTASDVLATLEPEAFSIPLYRKAFEVIRKQARNRNLIDALMVAEACGEEHFTSILMTSKNCPSAANLKGYAGMVADNYHRRLVLEIMDEMREPIQSGTIDASSQAMDELVKRLSAIRNPRDEVKPVRLGEIITDYTDTLDRRLRNGEESDTLKTGIDELDAITGGMNAEDLVIIAARPGMGKTELALKIAEGVASRVIPGSDVRRGVLIFSMEMSALQIAERSIANAGRMSVSVLRNPASMDDEGWARVANGMSQLADLDVWETGVLKKLYAAITDDQQAVAEKYGAGELWTLGKELVKTRKSIEDDAVTVLGRKLQQSAIPKVESAVVNMAKGNGGDFRQLMKSIPKDMRQEVALTSMNKAFTSYAKSPGQQLGVDGFVKWYNGMSRNGANMKALRDAIGTDASKRLDTIYQAAKAMNRLNTGKQYASSLVDQQVNNFLKEKGSLAKIYGIASKAAAAEGVTSLSGLPGVGATGVITSALMSGKTSRIKAADALLSSPEFKSMLFRLQNAPVDRAEVRRAIERKLMQSGVFKRWEKTLSTDEAKTIARTGIITWLSQQDTTASDGDQKM